MCTICICTLLGHTIHLKLVSHQIRLVFHRHCTVKTRDLENSPHVCTKAPTFWDWSCCSWWSSAFRTKFGSKQQKQLSNKNARLNSSVKMCACAVRNNIFGCGCMRAEMKNSGLATLNTRFSCETWIVEEVDTMIVLIQSSYKLSCIYVAVWGIPKNWRKDIILCWRKLEGTSMWNSDLYFSNHGHHVRQSIQTAQLLHIIS